MYSNKNIKTLILFIFFFTLIYFLFINQIIYPTIAPMVRSDAANLFTDWTVILQANICQDKGYDVFLENPCDYWGRKHVYGEILLFLPGIREIPKFYFLIFPIIINLLFIFTIVRLFTLSNNIKYFSIFIFMINPPVLLAIERANIDIIIFLITVLIAKNKNLLLKHILIIFATLCKIYPICLLIIFFFEKNIKKISINLGIIFSIALIITFFQLENLEKIFGSQEQFSGFGVYQFSFFGGFNFINDLNILIANKNYNWIKYIYLILAVLIPIIYIQYYFFKRFYAQSSLNNIFHEDNFESKLYILSSTIILLCYFLISNYIYREIFFLGLIPFILKEKKKINDSNFFSFYFYLLSFKFIFSSILIYINQNNIMPSFEVLFIIFKHSIDIYLVSLVAITYLFYVKNFFKEVSR